MPARLSARACAALPLMSQSARRESKCSERENSSAAFAGGREKRPPHIRFAASGFCFAIGGYFFRARCATRPWIFSGRPQSFVNASPALWSKVSPAS